MNQQQKLYTRLKNHVKFLRDFILDLLFPIECLECGYPGNWLCKKCFRKLKFNDKSYCLHCYKENDSGKFCSTCKNIFSLDGVMIAGDYKNKIIAKLIKTFKYNFNQNLSEILGNYLLLFLKNILNIKRQKNHKHFLLKPYNILLIPVPLHKKRHNWRGFNQAELLTKVIGKKFNLTTDSEFLIRKKPNVAQAKLKGKKRYDNLKNNFSWNGPLLSQKNIILIDDIVTTGTTLNECAKILKNAGAKKVWGLVIAKG